MKSTNWQYHRGGDAQQTINELQLEEPVEAESEEYEGAVTVRQKGMSEERNATELTLPLGSGATILARRRPLPLLSTQTSVLMELPSRQIDSPLPDLMSRDESGGCGSLGAGVGSNNSRKSRFATLRLKKAQMTRARDQLCLEELADNICGNAMLNRETPESEHLCLETIRTTHCSLTLKRQLRRKVMTDKMHRMSTAKRKSNSKRFAIKQFYQKLKRKSMEFFNKVDFWDRHLRTIGGHFGISTAYYFRFLKRLLILNSFSLIISVCFILVPQILYQNFGEVATTPDTSNGNDHDLVSKRNYSIVRAAEVTSQTYNGSSPPADSFQWIDLITGSGYFGQSAFYYGAYVNFSINVDSEHYYNIPLAYLLATSCHLLVSLFLLVSWVGGAYKKYISISHGYGAHTFCNLVFDSWDFSITSYEAAKQKRLGLTQELHERLQRLRPMQESAACGTRVKGLTRHVLNVVISATLLIGSGAIVWDILYNDRLQMDIPVLRDMAFSLVITTILVVLPFTFSMIITWEGYRAKVTEVYVTMLRLMLLLLIVLGVFCSYWFMSNSGKHTGYHQPNQDEGDEYCWETALGEEIYRLQLVDFFVFHLCSLVAAYVYKLTCTNIFGNSEFNLAWNTWNLIYTQMLCWLGAFYVPEISGIIIIKLILVFYLKMLHIRINCTPPVQPWGEFRTTIVFLSLAFVGSLAMLIPFGYTIIGMPPSQNCGPFRGKTFVYQVVTDFLSQFQHKGQTIANIGYYLFLPACVAAMLSILSAVAFQSKSHAHTTKHLVNRLKEQVMLEGKDKIFLLNMLTKATQKLEQRNSVATPQTEQQSLYDSLRKQKAKSRRESENIQQKRGSEKSNQKRGSEKSNQKRGSEKNNRNTVRFRLERPSVTGATFNQSVTNEANKYLPPLPPV